MLSLAAPLPLLQPSAKCYNRGGAPELSCLFRDVVQHCVLVLLEAAEDVVQRCVLVLLEVAKFKLDLAIFLLPLAEDVV